MVADFQVQNHGSLVLLKPVTDDADRWVEEYIDSSAQRWAGAVVVEPRYIQPILAGIADAGLSVEVA